MWITTSLMSFGTVVLLATVFPLSSSHTLSQSEAIELLQESNFTRPKRQLFREDIPHHRPLSGNHYARHHGFPHPGRWTNRPSMPVPVRPAESDDDFGNNIDSNFHNGIDNNYHPGHDHGANNYGSHLHTVDPTTITIHNEIVHEDGHGHGGNYGHGHPHPHPHPPPPPPPPPQHGYDEGGGYGNSGGYVEYGHESNRYGQGTGGYHGGGGGGGGGVEVGHNNANGGPHKTVVHFHPVQYGNFLPVSESEAVTYSPQNGYGPQSSHSSGPEVSTGFSGGYSSGPSHPEHHSHHNHGGGGGGGGESASFVETGSGSPHFQQHPHHHHHEPHPHRHYPAPGKEPIGVPIAIPVITHFHQSRPRRPTKIAFGSHNHGGIKFPTYIVHGHKPRRRPFFTFRRPTKARWIVNNYGH